MIERASRCLLVPPCDAPPPSCSTLYSNRRPSDHPALMLLLFIHRALSEKGRTFKPVALLRNFDCDPLELRDAACWLRCAQA